MRAAGRLTRRQVDRYCLPETQKLLVGNKSDIPVASRQAEAAKAQVRPAALPHAPSAL